MKDYEKLYKNAVKRIQTTYQDDFGCVHVKPEEIFPELKESDDERIRKSIIDLVEKQMPKSENKKWMIDWLERQKEVVEEYEDKLDRCACESFDKGYKAATEKIDAIENFDTEFEKQVSHLVASTINKEYEYTSDFVKWTANTLLNYAKHELEKKDGTSYPYQPGWRKNYSGNKPKVKHSVLMLTTHGIAEGEWLGEEWCQYRWSCKVKDTEVLYWMHLSDLENLEKENEKQGEQKPADKVEPKFKVGDWITIDNPCQIISIDGNYIVQYCDDEKTHEISKKFCEFQFHLWTIQDAKDGDVLATKDIVFIFKHMDKTGLSLCKSYCEVIGNSKLGLGFDFSINDVHPATKEQRDLLFQKMKEAGYEWDAEKKELKKIEPFKQKLTWSEEEKARIDKIIDVLDWAEEKGHIHHNDWEDYVCYVKSLKPQNTWKPSDEQIEVLYKYAEQNNHDGSVLTSLYRDLKKLM